ncbi:MAG TPA: phosphotransferase [Myxococcales bacterium]|nr:phosphotransferase [Myxococcales bacterium]
MNPWDAEREIAGELARALIEQQFSQLAPASVEPIGEGWDNQVFLVNDAWVFRFPRRAAAVPLLLDERLALPAVAGKLPWPVPRLEFEGAASERFPWPFNGYRFLPGRTADRAALTDAQRARLAAPLGRFLRALHSIAPPAGMPGDVIARLDAARLVPLISDRLRRQGVTPPAWIHQSVRAPRGGTLLHGDLHARQLLLDGAARVTGVIDWGDSHVGDAAVDLSAAHSFLPAAAHGEFRAAYGDIDDDTWRLSRLRALHVTAALADWARDRGDVGLQREARGGIDRIIQGA